MKCLSSISSLGRIRLKKILITGANGFIGKALTAELKQKYNPTLILQSSRLITETCKLYIDFSVPFNIKSELMNVEVIVHCAGRVHVMNDLFGASRELFKAVNMDGTLNLAQQAAESGVKRFVFISTINVNGNSTRSNAPFQANSDYIPTDPYSLSKYEAEVGLRKLAEKTGMEVVIIRPPLVYGPGVKANFASMMKWVLKGVPLPLGSIKTNKRSLVSIDNLVDLIVTCIDHPKAKNHIFLVSDDDDLSTTLLLKNMAQALGVKSKLLALPSSWFILAAKLINKPTISERLCGSLQVDISKTKEMLNWKPPYSSAECMKKTANAFLQNNK